MSAITRAAVCLRNFWSSTLCVCVKHSCDWLPLFLLQFFTCISQWDVTRKNFWCLSFAAPSKQSERHTREMPELGGCFQLHRKWTNESVCDAIHFHAQGNPATGICWDIANIQWTCLPFNSETTRLNDEDSGFIYLYHLKSYNLLLWR